MPEMNKIFLYRMTHIENIPHILQYGITHLSSPNANGNYQSIGDSSIISVRGQKTMPNGDNLGDYIPFYFGKRTPMLYVIQKGYNQVTATPPENIVYCVTSIAQIQKYGLNFVFTDGHAVDSFTSYFNPTDIEGIDQKVDFKAVHERNWKNEADLDLKRRKEAEFLVSGDVPPEAIVGYIVYNKAAQNKLIRFGVNEKIIKVDATSYF